MGLTKKRMILVGLESVTYGSVNNDFTLPAANGSYAGGENPTTAVKCGSLNITPLAGETVQRNIIQQYFGNTENIQVTQFATVDFEVELAGSGLVSSTGTSIKRPQYDKLLKACGFSSTETAADGDVTSGTMTYTPTTPEKIDETSTSIKIWFFNDNILHRLVGARGNVSFDLTVKKIPTMKFTFTGLLAKDDYAYSDRNTGVAFPSVNYKDFTVLPVSTLNTTPVSFFGLSTDSSTMPLTESITIDMANDVKLRTLIGGEHVVISDRKPKGNIKFECPKLATKNFFDLARQKTDYVTGSRGLSITHGTVTGNKVTIAATKLSIDAPKYGTNEGYDMLDMGLIFLPVSGNDELTITLS
jgi:hypothetical protein